MEKNIYVSRNGRTQHVKLRDEKSNPGDNDLTTKVNPSDTVIWQLDENSGLSEITGIKESDNSKRKYKNSQNLFDGPVRKTKAGWEATILSKSPGSGKFLNYMVGFKIIGDDKEHWDDPKIQMN